MRASTWEPNPAVVTAVGMATVDYLYVVDSHPAQDSENAVTSHAVAIGGPAGRAALTAGRLGADTRLLAMCGSDLHARVLRDQLTREPLSAQWFEVDLPSQHSCVILATDRGTRTTVWTAQPRADERLLASLDDALSGADVVLLDCTDPGLTTKALDVSRERGVPVVIDTGSYKPWVEEVLTGVEYVISPSKFFSARSSTLSLPDAMQAAYDIFGPTVLAATQGETGGRYIDRTGVHRYEPFAVTAVDTCGAGDTFHGAFAWAIAAGAVTEQAVRISSWVAAQKCSALGNDAVPDRLALDSFLAG